MKLRSIICKTDCCAKRRLLMTNGDSIKQLILGFACCFTLLAGNISGSPAHAEESGIYSLDIAAQNCADALLKLSEATDVLVLYPYEVASRIRSNPVTGDYSLSHAVKIMLKGTRLSGSLTKKGVITIQQQESDNTELYKNNGDFQMREKKNLLAAMIGIVSTVFTAQGVTAEDNIPVRKGGTGALIEHVFVTAQKKATAESAQNVPIAISAYSDEKIEAMFAQDLSDIGLTSPNVSLTPLIPGVGNFSIRGMGTVGQSIPSSDPAVGIVVDGISYGTIYGVLFDVFDLESVEVLRGPQGTIFGRNVTGGAVNVRTSRPTEEFQGKVKATIGSHSRRDFMASISGPINDQWSAKLAVLSKDHDDLWDNEFTNGGHGASDSLVVRPAIRYSNGSLDITAIAEHGETDGEGTALRNFYLDGIERNPYDKAESTQDEEGLIDMQWKSLSIEVNKGLWDGVLTTVVGYRDLKQRAFFDIDGAPNTARFHFAPGTGMDQDQFSLETRWAGNVSDSIYLTTGLYYFEQEYDYRERRFVVDAVDRRGASNIQHSTYALFAQANISLTDTLTVTLGGRYSVEEKEADIGLIGDPSAVGDCATQFAPFDLSPVAFDDCQTIFNDKEEWKNFTPKVSLEWTPTEDLLLYASYTRGFRSGGYNTRFTDLTFVTNNPTSTPGPYDEEVVDAYEIGMKSDWMDNRLRVNISIFYNEFEDLQRTALTDDGGQAVLNAASADITGVELETVFLLTNNLALEASFGYLDPSYNKADFLEDATGKPASSFDFTMVPDKTSSMAMTYDATLGDWGYLTTRLSYIYVDSTVGDDFNRAQISQYELYDASMTFTNPGEALKIAIFGKNLKDEVYTNFANDLSAGLGTKAIFLSPPRTYGIEFTYSF